ncbi:hypothetical protein [Campylobacter ureolyticus]|uniref:hypothetical protein n=1 Tax=Campylobacter ureolyticus TaxID=827 RepID=UPI0022B3A677|nr:hypothetical protein [Campylobacter ureolyticus]MCZ6174973.1 hypothetical protein [Campylobacter ureolyticus]
MNNEPKPSSFEKLIMIIVLSLLFFGATYIGTNEMNKKDAIKYCIYNSNSKICQKLAERCTLEQSECMDYTNDPIPIELLNNLSYTQINKMANKVKEIESKRIKKDNELEKNIKKEIHSIEIE